MFFELFKDVSWSKFTNSFNLQFKTSYPFLKEILKQMEQQTKRRALGRGLEELFNIEDINYNKIEERIMETADEKEVKEFAVSDLKFKPRKKKIKISEKEMKELQGLEDRGGDSKLNEK